MGELGAEELGGWGGWRTAGAVRGVEWIECGGTREWKSGVLVRFLLLCLGR